MAGVAFADLNLESAENAMSESKKVATNPQYQAIAIAVDISREDSVKNLVFEVLAKFGGLDYAVNSAGVSCIETILRISAEANGTKLQIGVKHPAEISETNLAEFDAFYNINVRGTLLFTKATSSAMKTQDKLVVPGRNGPRDLGRGVIINIGSCNSYVPTKGIVQYTAAKHAVMGITKNAGELQYPDRFQRKAITQ